MSLCALSEKHLVQPNANILSTLKSPKKIQTAFNICKGGTSHAAKLQFNISLNEVESDTTSSWSFRKVQLDGKLGKDLPETHRSAKFGSSESCRFHWRMGCRRFRWPSHYFSLRFWTVWIFWLNGLHQCFHLFFSWQSVRFCQIWWRPFGPVMST